MNYSCIEVIFGSARWIISTADQYVRRYSEFLMIIGSIFMKDNPAADTENVAANSLMKDESDTPRGLNYAVK